MQTRQQAPRRRMLHRRESPSAEAARNLRGRGQPNTSVVPYVSIHFSRRRLRHARLAVALRFEPGARTAWYSHPLGQILIVTSGAGWIQQWGGRKEEIREGDVVRIPPGQGHWHRATATTSMTHIAIQEEQNGKAVEWMEKVSDEEYRK